ncbi:small ribosomal subunit protein uS10m [Culicoides brevitarsis]|uniref:small ribosomal subunit protein uS10m n=1 Tax=Culicoides brevitarsis TaxID=469753 RepID=UPI00307C809D
MLSNILKASSCRFLTQSLIGTRQFNKFLSTEPAKVEKITVPLEEDKLFSKLEIELRAHDQAVMKSYSEFTTMTANNLGIEIGNCFALRKPEKARLTLLRSAHVHKKHRVQYEVRTYFRYMTFHKLTGSTLDTFLEYIERNLPEGVALKATKTEIKRLPDYLNIK